MKRIKKRELEKVTNYHVSIARIIIWGMSLNIKK